MSQLRLKAETKLTKGEVYSICLRGARRYSSDIYGPNSIDIEIFTTNPSRPEYTAKVVSQSQFSFVDLKDTHCRNNYDPKVTDKGTLLDAMLKVYSDFDPYEIVTLLNFEIQ